MAQTETTLVFGAVDKITPVLRGIEGQVKGLNTAFAAAAAGGIAALAATVAATVDSLDKLGDQARALNITTESLSGLGFAAQQSGSSAETLNAGLTRLNKTLGDAANGNKQAAALFDSLGISIKDAQGKVISADAALLQVASRFESYQDGAQEAAIATQLFGRSAGPELLALLNEGQGGIAALTDEAARLGVVVGGDAVAAAQAFSDNLDKLKAAGSGFATALTTAILPALNEFSTDAAEAAKNGGLLAEAGKFIGNELNLFSVDLIEAASEIEVLGAEVANAVAFLTDWSENLGVVGNIAIVTFQSIEAAASGNFAAAERGLDAITRAVDALGNKAAADAAKRMGDLASSISSIKADAAVKIERIKGGVEGLAKSAKPAADNAAKLPPPIIEIGEESEKAAAKVKKLGQEVERLTGFNLAFQRSLAPVSESMQSLVEDIDLGAISFDNLRESQAVLNQTTTEEAQFFADNWAGAVDAASDAFADFIAGNIKSFEDFGDALESIARQFLSNLVRQFLSTNLQFNVSGGPGGGLGAVGGSGFLNMLNGGGAALSTLGPAALLLAGASTGNRGTGALSGGLAGGLFASTTFGAGVIGSGLSGLGLGASLGSVVPIVGTIIGAIIGGLAANLFAAKPPSINVIGDDIVGTPGFRNFAPGSTFESRLGGFTFASIDSVDRQTRDQIGQSVVQFDNTIADLLNADQLDKVTDALAGFNLRLQEGAISAENILGQRFDAILATFDQDVQDFVNGAATLEERTARLAEILSRPQRLNALIESLEEVDRLSGLTPFERELDAINRQFDAAAEEARKLGADQAQLARIEELRGNAIERLNDLQRQNLDALLDDLRFDDLTDGLTPADRAIADINRRFDRLREQAIALGASQEDLELIERRRTAALREQADATRDSTDAIQEFTDAAQQSFQLYLDYQADWLEGLGNALQPVRDWLNRGGSVTSENPLQQLTRSQQQFEDLARRASLGDFDAIRGIAGAGDALLQQAARFYGVGSADFQRYEALVRGTLTPLASVDGSQSMAVALGQLREIYQALLRFLQGGNGATNSGVMSGAQAQQLLNSLDRLSRRTDRVT